MAKDPAILFYTSDFLTGTFTMTDEQVGRYIKLLCLQHQKGILQMSDLEFVCRGKDQVVFDKFQNDGKGNFFNKTLKEHSEKRAAYSESRRENRKPKKHMNNISKTYDKHMENVNENVNEIIIEKENLSKKEFEGLVYPFNSQEFLSAWSNWKTHLIEIKKPLQTFSSEQAGLQFLSQFTEQYAIELIKNCIKSNWKNLIDNKKDGQQGNKNSGKASTDRVVELAKQMLAGNNGHNG